MGTPSKDPLRRGRCLRNVNPDHLTRRLFSIMSRDVDKLMQICMDRLLTRDESAAVVNYTKLMKDLKKADSSLTDAELEALARKDS